MGIYRIAGVQMASDIGNIKGNLKRAEQYVREAAQHDVKLVVFPEMFVTGYNRQAIVQNAEPVNGDIVESLKEMARHSAISIIGGVALLQGSDICNASVLISPDGDVTGIYRKVHLFSLGSINENDYFKRGSLDTTVYDTVIGKVGLIICYDLRFPELSRKLALAGAQFIVAISAWPKARVYPFKTLCAARAIENQLYVMSVNRSGTDDELTFAGGTACYDPFGEILPGSFTSDNEGLCVVEADTAVITDVRGKMPCFKDRLDFYDL